MKRLKVLSFFFVSLLIALALVPGVLAASGSSQEIPLLILAVSYDADGDGVDDFSEGHLASSAEDAWFGEQWIASDNETLHNLFFGKATVSGYFSEISLNSLTYVPIKESEGTANDGIVRITLKTAHPDTKDSDSAWDSCIVEALQQSAQYIDYSRLDQNGDKIISPSECSIVVLHAGYTKSQLHSEPSERYPFGARALCDIITASVGDSLKISGSGKNNIVSLGETVNGTELISPAAIAHELLHTLGAHDLYNRGTGVEGWPQPYYFSLMHNSVCNLADGIAGRDTSNSIIYPDAYHRYLLNFCQSVTEVKTSGDFTLYSTLSGKYNLLKIATPDPDEYFLVEYREPTGFESGLSSAQGGFVVWLIDEQVNRRYFVLNEADDSAVEAHDPGVKLLARGITSNGYTYSTSPLNSPYYFPSTSKTESTFSSLSFSSPIGDHSVGLNRYPDGIAPSDFHLKITADSYAEDGALNVHVEMPALHTASFFVNGKLWKEETVLEGQTLSEPELPNDNEQYSWRLYTSGAPVYDFSQPVTSDFLLIWTSEVIVPETSKIQNLPQFIYVLLLLCCAILAFALQTLKGKRKGI